MSTFEQVDEAKEKLDDRFRSLIRACEHGWPTETLTEQFFDAERTFYASCDRVLGGQPSSAARVLGGGK